ncbi:MAG: phytanoyl-CoA dioxygenase family protein [Tatlockia sp.]|nr:phytanoyl-CoA dioxygenase family protein [Tatlockia sp.]
MDEVTAQFNKNGFVLLKNQFNSVALNLLNREYGRLHDRAKSILEYTAKEEVSLEDFYQQNNNELIVVPEASDSLTVCRFEYIRNCSDIFNEVVILKMQKLINHLVGQPCLLFKDKCNVKHPGGGAFPPHQDIAAYYHFKPQFHITAAVMLDDSTIQNGCLEMAHDYQANCGEDTHFVTSPMGKLPFFDFYRGGNNNGDIKSEISDSLHWEYIQASKGDVVLFHSFVPHRSQKNNSDNPRRNLFFTFNLAHEGDFYQDYYFAKTQNVNNPIFHVSTPTKHESRIDYV